MPGTANFDTHEKKFANGDALTEALAEEIAARLEEGLAAGRGASLLVAGGRTPVAVFERLSQIDLDWDNVWISLTDERWLDASNASSNEHLVREHLLRNAASDANFVGLKNDAAQARDGAARCWSAVAELPRPFDFVLLGMGDDGHTASLFPDSPGLISALDPVQPPGCVAMTAPVAPRERMSLNLRALLDSRRIAILISGDEKWATYERARVRGPVVDMPVRALWQQQNVPVTVYWAP